MTAKHLVSSTLMLFLIASQSSTSFVNFASSFSWFFLIFAFILSCIVFICLCTSEISGSSSPFEFWKDRLQFFVMLTYLNDNILAVSLKFIREICKLSLGSKFFCWKLNVNVIELIMEAIEMVVFVKDICQVARENFHFLLVRQASDENGHAVFQAVNFRFSWPIRILRLFLHLFPSLTESGHNLN